MKISIITVVKNGMPFIKDAINSYKKQNYKNKELIIILSNSDDNTEKFLKKKKIKFFKISKKDENRYHALNYGIKKAKGDVIGVLHSDDIFYKNNTIKVIANMFKKKNLEGVYGGVKFCKKNNIQNFVRIWKPKNITFDCIKLGMTIPHTSLFLKKKVFKKIGLYNTKFKISSDYDFIIRIFCKNINIINTNKYHCIMRIGGDSTNTKFFFKKILEDIIILKKNRLSMLLIFYKILSKIPQLLIKK